MSTDPRLRFLPILVAALSTLGPFTIDTYLPSFPEMALSLGATPLQVQQSLTFYLVPFALMNLWHGAISDAVGRRPVTLVALVLYTLASVGSAFAPRIEVLWFFRALQGLASGVGLVVGRAVVRDVHEGSAAQRVLSWVAVLYLVAPAVAPVLGGRLHLWWGWRSVFGFLAVLGLGLFLAVWGGLPETLPLTQRRPFRAGYLVRAYAATMAHGRFLAAALAVALNFSGLFLYIASAPAFLLTHLKVRETEFIWLFGPTTTGLVLGGLLSGRLAGRWSGRRTVMLGYGLMIGAACLNVVWHLLRAPGIPGSVLPLLLYATGMAFVAPTLTLRGLDVFPERKGMAASCQAFLITGANAITAGLVSPMAQGSVLRLAVVAWGLMAAGSLAALLHFRGTTVGGPGEVGRMGRLG